MLLSKSMRRIIRHHPITERIVYSVKSGPTINFHQINLTVSAGAGDVIIDCGANVGDLSSYFIRTGATVHAFEPNPLCYSILSRRFSTTPNITCHPFGVMDRECTLTLTTPEPHDQYDTIDVTVAASFVVSDNDKANASVEVRCIDLAAFITKLDSRIKLLKIDIEGAEIEVINHLLDARLDERIDMMLVETHERLSPELAVATDTLRERVDAAGLNERIRLDWI